MPTPKPPQKPAQPAKPPSPQPQAAETPPPSPAPAPATTTAPRMVRTPDPAPNPLQNAPAPTLTVKNKGGRPRKVQPASSPATTPGAPPPPAEAPAWSLPADPVERERILAEQRPFATMIVASLSSIAARLPPREPLSQDEQTALQGPLEECLAKWGSPTTPEGRLFVTLGTIALIRYAAVKGAELEAASKPSTETVGDRPPDMKPRVVS